MGDESGRKHIISPGISMCPLADRSESGRIAYCFMRACIRKVRWLSMKDKVPSGRKEFKPMEISPATFEVGSSLRKLGEGVTLKHMEKIEAYQISEWHYEPPYSFYDLNADLEDAKEFLDFEKRPDNKYFSVIDNSGDLAEFFELNHKDDCIEIGLGMRQNLTGKGKDLSFVKAGLEYISKNYAPKVVKLQVLSSNKRVQIVYKRAGFNTIRTVMVENSLGENEFVEMELNL
ncbi:MAG: GNAT family N-acetyltransferase [Thermoplasmataceae archaeon]